MIRKQDDIGNKEFAAVLIDGQIKVMSARKRDKLLILSGYKDKSDIQVIMPGKPSQVKIVGKAVKMEKSLE